VDFLTGLCSVVHGQLAKRNQMLCIRSMCEHGDSLGMLRFLHESESLVRFVSIADMTTDEIR
jgi:hypothetical protein